MAIAGPDFQSPPPEPYFGLDAPLVEAERPPEVVADDLPTGARALSTRPPVERPQMPERLALGDAPTPIVQAIVPQALPTAGRFTPPPEPAQPATTNNDTPLVPPPGEPEDPAAQDTAEPPDAALRALVTRRDAARDDVGGAAEDLGDADAAETIDLRCGIRDFESEVARGRALGGEVPGG